MFRFFLCGSRCGTSPGIKLEPDVGVGTAGLTAALVPLIAEGVAGGLVLVENVAGGGCC